MHGRSTRPGPPDVAAPTAPPAPGQRLPADPPPAPGERTTSPGAMAGTVATLPHHPSGGAVVHLGRTGARVARDRAEGRTEVISVPRRSRGQRPAPYLVRILHAVGDRAPVVIGGLADERTALEREFVRIGHHPERFIEDPHLDAVDEGLRLRLRALHAHPG
jgi:hypothetical protein